MTGAIDLNCCKDSEKVITDANAWNWSCVIRPECGTRGLVCCAEKRKKVCNLRAMARVIIVWFGCSGTEKKEGGRAGGSDQCGWNEECVHYEQREGIQYVKKKISCWWSRRGHIEMVWTYTVNLLREGCWGWNWQTGSLEEEQERHLWYSERGHKLWSRWRKLPFLKNIFFFLNFISVSTNAIQHTWNLWHVCLYWKTVCICVYLNDLILLWKKGELSALQQAGSVCNSNSCFWCWIWLCTYRNSGPSRSMK